MNPSYLPHHYNHSIGTIPPVLLPFVFIRPRSGRICSRQGHRLNNAKEVLFEYIVTPYPEKKERSCRYPSGVVGDGWSCSHLTAQEKGNGNLEEGGCLCETLADFTYWDAYDRLPEPLWNTLRPFQRESVEYGKNSHPNHHNPQTPQTRARMSTNVWACVHMCAPLTAERSAHCAWLYRCLSSLLCFSCATRRTCDDCR